MHPLIDQLHQQIDRKKSLVCVGLDSDSTKMPAKFLQLANPQLAFNQWVIDQVWDFTVAFKLNTAFYEARGELGWTAMRETVRYIKQRDPQLLVIADAKRADIGNTNDQYVQAFFDDLGFDAITIHPYLGQEAIQPFLNREDKLAIILCRTSNQGAGELQDLTIAGQPLWQRVATNVVQHWNVNDNCMLVVGATYPDEMKQIRQQVGDDLFFLVPGVGAQGGDVRSVLTAGANARTNGLLLNSSRGIIFADNPQSAAMSLQQEIQQVREEVYASARR